MEITTGSEVLVRTAAGDSVRMVAVSPETQGRDVRIVWVAEREDFIRNRDEAFRIPWPANAVRLVVSAA